MLRCLIASVGKDAPGVNALIRAGTRLGLRSEMEVYGVKRGFRGILDDQFHKMKIADVGFIIGKGGSLLGSTDFRISPDDRDTLNRLGESLRRFDLVITAGGLGSFTILNKLYELDLMGITTTFFVPASIENEFLNPAAGGQAGAVHAERLHPAARRGSRSPISA